MSANVTRFEAELKLSLANAALIWNWPKYKAGYPDFVSEMYEK